MVSITVKIVTGWWYFSPFVHLQTVLFSFVCGNLIEDMKFMYTCVCLNNIRYE